ncbi:MAG: helix-turn-helix domain-containing protein [Oscillospiraceae bacterium]|nr:helix-turn-helix domain-containing protein [Oscillospiraceae bacterium]
MIGTQEKLSYSIREVATLLGIGMNTAYALAHSETGYPVIWITKKKAIVPAAGLLEWLKQKGDRAND